MRDDDPSSFRSSRHGCSQFLHPIRPPCRVRKYCLVARSMRALDSLTGYCGLSLPVLKHGALAMANSGQPTSYKTEYCAQARNYCRLGATNQELAKFFEVSPRTID